MKSLQTWLVEYGESHQNPTNKLIHWCAVPLIYLCVFGLLWEVPVPMNDNPLWLNWATIALVPVLLFYFSLSFIIGVAMTIFSAVVMAMVMWYESLGWSSVALACIVVFVICWIFQFIGHAIEGKKPSFFKDLQFLLIGPVWLMADLLRRVGVKY